MHVCARADEQEDHEEEGLEVEEGGLGEVVNGRLGGAGRAYHCLVESRFG